MSKNNNDNSIRTIMKLYEKESQLLFQRALQYNKESLEPSMNKNVDTSRGTVIGIRGKANFLSDDDVDCDKPSSSSESSSEGEGDDNVMNQPLDFPSNMPSTTASHIALPLKPNIKNTNESKQKKQKEEPRKQMGTPPSIILPLQPGVDAGKKVVIVAPSLFPKNLDVPTLCSCFQSLSEELSSRPVVVLLLRSGRFAGAVFQNHQVLVHTTSVRYTVRRGQGGAQTSNDTSKGNAKSIGAQLRRAGEVSLRNDVAETLHEWRTWIQKAVIIFLSCPKVMLKGLFEDTLLDRKDERIRRVPLDTGKPSFENACAIYDIMMEIKVCSLAETENSSGEEEEEISIERKERHEENEEKAVTLTQVMEKEIVPLTPLHEAAKEANLIKLMDLLNLDLTDKEGIHPIDIRAGEKEMTPLHYAASASDVTNAASCVKALLLTGNANPCIVDSHNRPPVFLSTSEKVRDAFRLSRAQLGEAYCLWDESAKVGPPITVDDVQKKKEKLAEKKRNQRARQKEQKAKDMAKAQEQARLEQEASEKKKAEDDAQRVRAGLQPKATTSDNVCDFCQTSCKRRNQMLSRLDFVYCSTDCVMKHQRELMAGAAAARLGLA